MAKQRNTCTPFSKHDEHIRTPEEHLSTPDEHISKHDEHIIKYDEHISTQYSSTSCKSISKAQDATKGVETQSCLSERKRRKTDGDKENPGDHVDPLI